MTVGLVTDGESQVQEGAWSQPAEPEDRLGRSFQPDCSSHRRSMYQSNTASHPTGTYLSRRVTAMICPRIEEKESAGSSTGYRGDGGDKV
jgi:hypothetical protein